MPQYKNLHVPELREGCVTFTDTVVLSNNYSILVDLDDTVSFPHSFTGSIDIDHLSMSVKFLTNTAEAYIKIGVITRVDATDADISWLIVKHFASQSSKDSINIFEDYTKSIPFHQSAGSVVDAVTNDNDFNNIEVSTLISIPSPVGNILPAVGDVICKAEYFADGYDYTVSCAYHSHE